MIFFIGISHPKEIVRHSPPKPTADDRSSTNSLPPQLIRDRA
jgi:hypothetical protein